MMGNYLSRIGVPRLVRGIQKSCDSAVERRRFLALFSLILCFFMHPCFSMNDVSQDVLIERIRPLGAVHVEPAGEKPAAQPSQPVALERTGEDIFGRYCSICHESGVAGAPKFGHADEWQPRIDKAGGVNNLLPIVTQGLNAMPPKGTCQDCSQEELKRAIDYMIGAIKK